MVEVYQESLHCLLQAEPKKKCLAVFAFQERVNTESLDLSKTNIVETIANPGRPDKPKLVSPHNVAKRNLATQEGRIALIHAIAHIEFNAINLALDAMYRFQEMPEEYYKDWMQVAFEEAQHFTMLSDRLNELGCTYGDYDAHNGLWEMALKTQHSVIARMALVPRGLEARGLDGTPGMIKRLHGHGDTATVEILKIIFEQEIGHVAEETFQDLLKEYMAGELRGPFELEARKKAGFSSAELEALQNT